MALKIAVIKSGFHVTDEQLIQLGLLVEKQKTVPFRLTENENEILTKQSMSSSKSEICRYCVEKILCKSEAEIRNIIRTKYDINKSDQIEKVITFKIKKEVYAKLYKLKKKHKVPISKLIRLFYISEFAFDEYINECVKEGRNYTEC